MGVEPEMTVQKARQVRCFVIRFSCVTYVIESSICTTESLTPLGRSKSEEDSVPIGSWKDGLFGCFRFGFFHPSLWHATFCPQILLAQVSTRYNLDWRGETHSGDKSTFIIVLRIVAGYWVLCFLLAPNAIGSETKSPLWRRRLYDLLSATFGLYTLIYITRV